MEIKGKLTEKFSTQQITDTFKKQEFVIEYAQEEYPEFIKFQTIQDRCGQIDSFEIGSELIVSFDLKGRKWVDPEGETKYFTNLQAWKLQAVAETPPTTAPPVSEGMDQREEPAPNDSGEDDGDDLPF